MRLKHFIIAAFALFCIQQICVKLDTIHTRVLRAKAVQTGWWSAVFHPQNERAPISRTGGAGENTIFLLGILTRGPNESDIARRQLIRDTYLSYGNDVRVCSLNDYMSWKDENSERASICKLLYTFVIGGANNIQQGDHFRSDRPITITPPKGAEESDCTYLNVRENMNDGKTNAWWKYSAMVAKSHDIDYVAKVDSDVILSTSHFLDFIITDLPPYPYNVRTYGGNMLHNPLKMDRGHFYASGQFVFLSCDMAAFVSDDALDRVALKKAHIGIGGIRNATRVNAEDVETGTLVWMHPYPIKLIFMGLRYPWIHKIKEESEWISLWEDWDGVVPLSRVIGRFDHKINAGTWKKEYEKRNNN